MGCIWRLGGLVQSVVGQHGVGSVGWNGVGKAKHGVGWG